MINLYLIKFLYILIYKKILIKSKIANNNQIVVNGCPRCDYAFTLRKISPKKIL